MTWDKIVTMLPSILSMLYAVILTIVLIVRSIKARKKLNTVEIETTNQPEVVYDGILELLLQLPTIVSDTENKFKNMFGNIKTGAFKLDSALSIMRDMCDNNGLKFDRDFWTNAINNIVSVMKAGNEVHNVNEDKKITYTEN